MKILFDTQDVTDKFAQLLANEGIQAADILWGGDAGAPTVEVVLDENPDVTVKPLRVELEELKQKIESLEDQLAAQPNQFAPTATTVSAPPRRGRPRKLVSQPAKTPEEAPTGTVASPEEDAAKVASALAEARAAEPESERVRKIRQQMKDEENIWGHPLGSTFQQGARPIGAHESYTPPYIAPKD